MKRSVDSSDELEKKPRLEETVTEEVVEQEHEISEDLGNIVAVHMDITEPLNTLRTMLEQRLHCLLADHTFYLQDSQVLDPSKNLVEQCVQGEGLVQINVEIVSKPDCKPKINIVDVLKPADEILQIQESETQEITLEQQQPTLQQVIPKLVIPIHEESENVTRWMICQNFRKDQDRLKIPVDPYQWDISHVKHWIGWAQKEFNLDGVDVTSFNITGKQLCELNHDEFSKKVPYDKGDLFWTHLELLRKCKFVAVVQQPTPNAITTVTISTTPDGKVKRTLAKTSRPRSPRITGECNSLGNRTGNNGQIQLWQFLLELLTDKDSRPCIQWLGDDGEFKLNNPEMVAQLWGQRKNKPTMNYEKLSRALRYYYDGDMIAKVHGKRFVYKFVCDLKGLLGYSAGELNRLVSECEQKTLDKVRTNFSTGSKKSEGSPTTKITL